MDVSGHTRFEATSGNCTTMLAEDQPDTAVVFVHGWGGDSDTTWANFHILIDKTSEQTLRWSKADIFFYKYDSVEIGIRPNALDFGDFLSQIFPKPAQWVLTEPLNHNSAMSGLDGDVIWRENFPGYSQLVVVAHSAGATVVRHWFLDLANELDQLVGAKVASEEKIPNLENLRDLLETAASPPKEAAETFNIYSQERRSAAEQFMRNDRYACLGAHLRLFAPAHCGASISGKYGALLEIAGSLGRGVLQHSTMAVDLAPVSPLISNLRPKTERMARLLSNVTALFAQILWGRDDKIVYMDKFDCDHDTFVPGQDHVSVCKPNLSYRLPLQFVFHGSKTAAV